MVARSFVGLALAATASAAAVPRSEATTWAVSEFWTGVQWHSSIQQTRFQVQRGADAAAVSCTDARTGYGGVASLAYVWNGVCEVGSGFNFTLYSTADAGLVLAVTDPTGTVGTYQSPTGVIQAFTSSPGGDPNGRSTQYMGDPAFALTVEAPAPAPSA